MTDERKIGMIVGPIRMTAKASIHVLDSMSFRESDHTHQRLMRITVQEDGSVYVTPFFSGGRILNTISSGDLNALPGAESVDLSKRLPFYIEDNNWSVRQVTQKVGKISFHPTGICGVADRRAYRQPFLSAEHFSLLCNCFFTDLHDLPRANYEAEQSDNLQMMYLHSMNRPAGIVASIWVGPIDGPVPSQGDRFGPVGSPIMEHRYDIQGLKQGRTRGQEKTGPPGISLLIYGGASLRQIKATGIFLPDTGPLDQFD